MKLSKTFPDGSKGIVFGMVINDNYLTFFCQEPASVKICHNRLQRLYREIAGVIGNNNDTQEWLGIWHIIGKAELDRDDNEIL